MQAQLQYQLVTYENIMVDGSLEKEKVLDAVSEMNYLWQQEDGVVIGDLEFERAMLQNIVEQGNITFVLAYDATGEAVGYGMMHPFYGNRTQAEFEAAFVKPQYRQQGIFGGITTTICAIAERHGYTDIVASPTVKDQRSTRILERQGFSVFGSDKSVTSGTEQLYLTKHLRSATPEGNPKRHFWSFDFDKWRRK